MGVRDRIGLRAKLLCVAALAVAGFALAPSSASAFSASCSTPTNGSAGTFFASPGEKNALRVGYRGSDNSIRFIDAGTNGIGNPIGFDFNCPGNGPWNSLTFALGDRSDTARLDGAGGDHGPVQAKTDVFMHGGPGADVLRGHAGVNALHGDAGSDRLIGLGASDLLFGGRGKDRLNAAHGGTDIVDCGPGLDKATVDRSDKVKHCERVRVT